MNYGRAIKIVRTAHGMTLAQFAERVSVGPSHLSLIESGRRSPSVEVLQEIADGLETPLHLLTLLASDPSEFNKPSNSAQVVEAASALVRLLAASGRGRQ